MSVNLFLIDAVMIICEIDASRYFETVFIYIFLTGLIIFTKTCSISIIRIRAGGKKGF